MGNDWKKQLKALGACDDSGGAAKNAQAGEHPVENKSINGLLSASVLETRELLRSSNERLGDYIMEIDSEKEVVHKIKVTAKDRLSLERGIKFGEEAVDYLSKALNELEEGFENRNNLVVVGNADQNSQVMLDYVNTIRDQLKDINFALRKKLSSMRWNRKYYVRNYRQRVGEQVVASRDYYKAERGWKVEDARKRSRSLMASVGALLRSDAMKFLSEESAKIRDYLTDANETLREAYRTRAAFFGDEICEQVQVVSELSSELKPRIEEIDKLLSIVLLKNNSQQKFTKLKEVVDDGRLVEMLKEGKRKELLLLYSILFRFIDLVERRAGDDDRIKNLCAHPVDFDDFIAEFDGMREDVISIDNKAVDDFYRLFQSCLLLWNNPPKNVEKGVSDMGLKKRFYSIWCGPANKRTPILMKDGDELKFAHCTKQNDSLELASIPVTQAVKDGMIEISDGEFCTRDGAKLPQDLSGYVKNAFHLILIGDQILPSPKNKGGFKVKKNRNMDGDGESLKPRTQGQVVLASLDPDTVTDGKLLGSGGHYKAYIFGNKTVVEFDQEAHGTYFFDTEYFVDLKEWSRSEILAEQPEGFHGRVIHPKGKWDSWRDRVEDFITAP